MSRNGSLVGVTSHTTPLPAGEGKGEGPLSFGLEMYAKNLRELCALCERKKYPQWEKEQPKNLVSRPIGVTSHTTPLPTGEGTGEGPAGEGRRTCWGREADQLFSVSGDPYKDSNKGAKKSLETLLLSVSKLWVAGAGLEHATSRLWAWRATNCSNPRY